MARDENRGHYREKLDQSSHLAASVGGSGTVRFASSRLCGRQRRTLPVLRLVAIVGGTDVPPTIFDPDF